MNPPGKHKKLIPESAAFCAECMSPLKNGLDSDSEKFFSEDLFCRCGEDDYRLKELEEVRGDLRRIEKAEDGCLVLIGKIPALLPEELAGKLKSLEGRRVGVLRLEGFHVRDLSEEHA
jgi:hypothetical protein